MANTCCVIVSEVEANDFRLCPNDEMTEYHLSLGDLALMPPKYSLASIESWGHKILALVAAEKNVIEELEKAGIKKLQENSDARTN